MKLALTLIFALWTLGASAEIVRESYQSTRALGMGNAFLAISDDATALWYNPAGLARIKGAHFNLIDTSLKIDGRDTLTRVGNAVFHGDFNNLIRQDLQAMAFSMRPTFVTKYFGISFFENVSSFSDFRDLNSLSATADIYTFNDVGLILGVGVPFSDYFSLGVSVRAFQRSSLDTVLTTETLISQIGIDADNFQNAIYNYLKTQFGTGWGVGMNLGAMAKIPIFGKGGPDWTVAFLGENLGGVHFRKLGSQNKIPNDLKMTYHVGTAFRYPLTKMTELNLTFDYRHLFETDVPGPKKVHIGMEYRGLGFDLRAGLHQLYPSFGFGLKFPAHTRVNLATYGVELGDNALERMKRLWEVQLVLAFNPL